MLVYFAGDHAGFEMKGKLMEFVRSLGHQVEDLGPHAYDQADDFVDYVIPLAKKVAKAQMNSDTEGADGNQRESAVRGIVVAGSGQGEIIAMNRIPGARAALFCSCNLELVRASRDHNDSNIFAVGARFCTPEEARKGIKVWLETPFSGEERHVRRLQKIEQMTDNL